MQALYIIFLLLSFYIFSDELILKNGDQLVGTFIESDGQNYTFKSSILGTLKISKDQIKSLNIGNTIESSNSITASNATGSPSADRKEPEIKRMFFSLDQTLKDRNSTKTLNAIGPIKYVEDTYRGGFALDSEGNGSAISLDYSFLNQAQNFAIALNFYAETPAKIGYIISKWDPKKGRIALALNTKKQLILYVKNEKSYTYYIVHNNLVLNQWHNILINVKEDHIQVYLNQLPVIDVEKKYTIPEDASLLYFLSSEPLNSKDMKFYNFNGAVDSISIFEHYLEYEDRLLYFNQEF